MAPNPQQVPSRTCGCPDCLIDLPPGRYGYRPEQDGCSGPWRARYRIAGGKRARKNFTTRADAVQFLVQVTAKARSDAS
ncbi:MAG: hypothetical protein HOV92_18115 [Streptomyces sp.]|nr:hypothetical protein [Streptomyces sp.]